MGKGLCHSVGGIDLVGQCLYFLFQLAVDGAAAYDQDIGAAETFPLLRYL